ncbi:MAG: hypothetical protein FIA97_18325, partial [Methylococcaceae bacterium]|nr:hypothetical protein [Methylococcaceae bacterium]
MSFRVRHPYYRSGYCSDFQIQPAEDTARLLRRHRCSYKATGGIVRIMVELGQTGAPFIPFTGESTITLELVNPPPHFQTITRSTTASLHKNDGAPYEVINFSYCAGNRIALTAAFTNPENEPLNFELRFEAAEHKWLYYLLTNQAETADSFNIKHTQTSNPIAWIRSVVNSDDPILQLAGRYPGAKLIRFESSASIPCSEQPVANLSLCYGTS